MLKWPLAVMHPHVANAFRFAVSAGVLGAVYGGRCWWTDTSFLDPIRANWRAIVPLGLLAAPPVLFAVGVGTAADRAVSETTGSQARN